MGNDLCLELLYLLSLEQQEHRKMKKVQASLWNSHEASVFGKYESQ